MVVTAAWGGGQCGVGWWSVRRGVAVRAAWGGGGPRRDTGRNFFEGVPYSTVIKSDFRVVFPCR